MVNGVKIEKTSKIVLFWTIALISILTAINYFMGEWGVLAYVAPSLVFGTALFVFIEVKYFEGFKKKDPWRIGGVIIAMLAMLGVILELLPQLGSVQILDTLKGFVLLFLAVYFVGEGLR